MTTELDSVDTSTETARHGLGRAEYIAMSSLITATIAMSIDTVLPAFDEIEADFGLTESGPAVSLTLTVFFAAMGIATLVWGPLADRFGRKPIMFTSLALVIVGALISSFAPSFVLFLIGRAIWGAAAAGPRTVIVAMTRDSYEGDAMSRIMSLSLAVFLIVPVIAPSLGEVLLLFGSWRYTTLAGAALAFVGAIWFLRAEETLAPADALPLEFGRVGRAAKAVISSKQTVLFTIASTMAYGSFFPWLGSSPTLIGDIYDRDAQFALLFGLNAIIMAVSIVLSERMVRRYSTLPVIMTQVVMLTVAAAAYVITSLMTNGQPSFWLWFALVSALTALNSTSSPLLQTMAMQPMAAIAGTAASVTGAAVFLGGALIGAVVDSAIDDSVTPLGVGFLVAGLVMLASLAAVRDDLDEI